MRCSRETTRLHLYVDGRLNATDVAALERHVRGCSNCQLELAGLMRLDMALRPDALPDDAPDLVPSIMARVAALETMQRAAIVATPGQPVAVPASGSASAHRDIRRQVVAVLALAVAVIWLLGARPASAWSSLNREWVALVQVLLAPGPDSVAWLVWGVAGIALVVVAARIMRADSYAAWRRAVAQRLPQLW